MNERDDLLGALDAADRDADLQVDGRTVRVSNLERVLWPGSGTTKRDYLRYLLGVAPALLPELRDRAVTMARFPEGVYGPGWYQAECRGRPEWLRTHAIPGRRGGAFTYCLFDDAASLVWAANLGTLEFHPFNWTVECPAQPLALLFDLDPGDPAGLRECSLVALMLRDALTAAGCEVRAKSSGSLGVHLVATPAPASFEAAKEQARSLAQELAAAEPGLVVAESPRHVRAGRVFIDWLQNDPARSTIAAYSLRATPLPRASVPVAWHEVESAAAGDLAALRFGPSDVLERLAEGRDPWAGTLPASAFVAAAGG